MSEEAEPSSGGEAAKHPLQERLSEFFSNNPEAGFEAREGDEGPCRISTPWGDETLAISVKEDSDSLLEALNNLYLPPRFTAIYHLDKSEFESIWTAFAESDELIGRSFEFSFGDNTYQCEFAGCSDRLIEIGRSASPVGPAGRTGHRKLYEFSLYAHSVDEHPDSELAEATPTSLWIHDIEWDDTHIQQVARHLNFYMAFFDRETPVIGIHEPMSGEEPEYDTLRFPGGEFPEKISGGTLDSHLLSLWESAHLEADPFKKFIYNYQILEYVSFYYVRDEVRREIRRLLREPDLRHRPDEFAKRAAEALSQEQLHETQKFEHTFRELVKPDVLWQSIVGNREYFAGSAEFDGGFTVEPLINKDWTLADFQQSWFPKFPKTVRDIRNALVHGREEKQTTVILPTASNYNLLQPWIEPLALSAVHAMVYWEY